MEHVARVGVATGRVAQTEEFVVDQRSEETGTTARRREKNIF